MKVGYIMSDKKINQEVQESTPVSLTEQIKQLVEQLSVSRDSVEYFKPEVLPNIDLYMDQVTTFMEKNLQSTKRYEDDKILTKTMINNYAKNDLLPPPEKKKYSKDHILLLTLIYYLKSMFSMSDIQCLLKPLRKDYFQGNNEQMDLSKIYQSAFLQIEALKPDTIDDIIKKYNDSRNHFEGYPDLQELAFVWLLCYDIYKKKQLVERIIDKMADAQASEDADKKKK